MKTIEELMKAQALPDNEADPWAGPLSIYRTKRGFIVWLGSHHAEADTVDGACAKLREGIVAAGGDLYPVPAVEPVGP